jgi:coenzyme F420-reducing hydrogenase delta subunit
MNPCIVCSKDIPMTHAVRMIPGVDGVPIGVQHLYKCKHQETVIEIQTKTTLVQKIKTLLGVK